MHKLQTHSGGIGEIIISEAIIITCIWCGLVLSRSLSKEQDIQGVSRIEFQLISRID